MNLQPISLKEKVSLWVKSQLKNDDFISKDGGLDGVVYFVSAVGSDFWKVGFSEKSSGVIKRVRSMQTGCPYELVLKAIKPQCSRHSEYNIHSLMMSFRVRGEWFYYNEWIRQIVKTWPKK